MSTPPEQGPSTNGSNGTRASDGRAAKPEIGSDAAPADEKVVRPPADEVRGGFGGRMGAVGMPLERSMPVSTAPRGWFWKS